MPQSPFLSTLAPHLHGTAAETHSPGSGRLGGQCLQGVWHVVGHRASCPVLVASPAL